jgi:hypothetical protein
MTTSKVNTFLVALKAMLEAREGLSGVGVFTAHPGDELPREAIVVDRVTTDQSWAALGRQRREEGFTTYLILHIEKAGAGEGVATDVRERVYAIKAEVEDALRADPTVSETVRVADYARDELRQGTGDRARWAQLEAQIDAKVRI